MHADLYNINSHACRALDCMQVVTRAHKVMQLLAKSLLLSKYPLLPHAR